MLNKIVLIGRLTTDPELKVTTNGTPVTSFNIAVDRDYTSQGAKITDFPTCVAWRGTAEFITRYFNKGKLIAVEGKLESRSYEDKDGNKRTVWEVIVSNAYFGGDKSESSNNASNDANDFEEIGGGEDDDLPF